MNKLILCEGKTDAILLSYYLGKTAGWKFVKKGPSGLAIQQPNDNESISWYEKDDDYLLILLFRTLNDASFFTLNSAVSV